MLIRITKKGQFVIPSAIRKSLGLVEGDKLLLTKVGSKLVFYPVGTKKLKPTSTVYL